jgi:hypothetical protein
MMKSHVRTAERKPIPPRPLTIRERELITEILQANAAWADVDASGIRVVAKCDCGNCRSVYLDSDEPQNPSARGTHGYIGRMEIRTIDDFGVTVTLDQRDGRLDELYVNYVDLAAAGDRTLPENWKEIAHTTEPM